MAGTHPARRAAGHLPEPRRRRHRIYAETSLIGVSEFRTFAAQIDCTPDELAQMLHGWDYTLRHVRDVVHVSVWGPLPGSTGSIRELKARLALPPPRPGG